MIVGDSGVELDNSILEASNNGQENWATSHLREHGFEKRCINEWGFKGFEGVRGFKTGSVAAMPTEDIQPLHSASM